MADRLAWDDSNAVLHAGGHRLEYATFGPPPDDAPTLLLLHEGLGCTALWRDWPDHLSAATGMGVLAYSRAGYGRSDAVQLPRPLDYMTQESATLGEVITAFGLQQTVLFGHSDGATIAAIYAGTTADTRLRGLILAAPHFFVEPVCLTAIRAAGRAFDAGPLQKALSKHHRDATSAFKGWHDAWTDPGFADWNVSDVIPRWQVPALAIQGRDDPYGTLAQITCIETHAQTPVHTAILDNCAHAPHTEQPEKTLHAVTDFCAGLPTHG